MSIQDWLHERNHLTELLEEHPYDLVLYLERATAYTQLEYYDLAAGDAYKALLLTDEVRNEVEEYHEQAQESLELHLAHHAQTDRLHTDHAGRCPCLGNSPRLRYVRDEKLGCVENGAIKNELDHDKDGPFGDDDATSSKEQPVRTVLESMLEQKTLQCYGILAQSLFECGCLRSAMEFCERGLSLGASTQLQEARDLILHAASEQKNTARPSGRENEDLARLDGAKGSGASDFDVRSLPEQGQARREAYSWNGHEPDRFSSETLQALNEQVAIVAPACEVRMTSLPLLSSSSAPSASKSAETHCPSSTSPPTAATEEGVNTSYNQNEQNRIRQLGLFAKEDIPAGQGFLREKSVLTATTRLHENMCDACGKVLDDPVAPASAMASSMFARLTLEDDDGEKEGHTDVPSRHSSPLDTIGSRDTEPVSCPECIDTIFCSVDCLSMAQRTYHAAMCGKEGETNLAALIAKDVPASHTTDTLYTLLLGRALTMAIAQDVHPLELQELKYIWGDFSPASPSWSPEDGGDGGDSRTARLLPFSFEHNIASPLHILQALDVDIYASLSTLSDTWIFETIYAKLRGTASAKISTAPPSSALSPSISQGADVNQQDDDFKHGEDSRGDNDSTDNVQSGPRIRLLPSARQNLPDVAAVHPLWCLANHSCDPNVAWEWKDGEMRFWARRKDEQVSGGISLTTSDDHKRKDNSKDHDHRNNNNNKEGEQIQKEEKWQGIRKGQEILSHYCDITLPYRERREWMMGCLGGECMCERCLAEENLERQRGG